MLQKWQSLNTLSRVAIILLIAGFFAMIIGLSLIGSVDHGFSILNILGVSDILKMSKHEFGDNGLSQLKTGIVFAVIFTPLLIGSSLIIVIYLLLKE